MPTEGSRTKRIQIIIVEHEATKLIMNENHWLGQTCPGYKVIGPL